MIQLSVARETDSASHLTSRIQILDVIRGIAVLGILGVNIFYFAFPEVLVSGFPVTDPDQGIGYSLGILSEICLSGKMRSLFAMLFGISSVIIIERLGKRYSGHQATQIFFRRMFWLLIIGQAHGFLLLFPGDVLFHYAIMGMIAFPLYKASFRTRTLVMVICLAALTYKPYRDYIYTLDLYENYAGIMQQETPKEELTEEDQQVIKDWERATKYISPVPEDYADEVKAKLGGYLAAFEFNKSRVVRMATYDLYNWYSWEVVLYMLLGIALFQSGFFSKDYPNSRLRLVAILGLMVGGSLHAWLHLGFYANFSDHARSIFYLIFFDLGRLPMVLGYVALISLLFRLKLFGRLGTWLAATGKMTLTNYLMQSIIAACLFYWCGLFNNLSRAQLGLVVLTIWLFQILFSNIWIKSFTYGPFEWVWRSLTYCSAQKLKR